MGELWRRYWLPVAASGEMEKEPIKAVQVLGEKLVLYKDRSGTLGLIQEACAHRRVNLLYGIPEQTGLRCPYHGWLYNEKGQCLEQPAEAPDSTFKDRIKLTAYPVKDFSGLIWAYLGPEPAPLIPHWDLLVKENVYRQIGMATIPCNWLQAMENSMDPVHLEWLHGYYFRYVLEKGGLDGATAMDRARPNLKRHKKIGFDVFEHGIIKRRVWGDQTEEHEDWKVGHPILFPNILRVGGGGLDEFQFRVPINDTSIVHYWYSTYSPPGNYQLPKQEKIPHYQVPVFDKDSKFIVDFVNGQDSMAWASQGPIVDRSLERLAESDRGIILYRRLLREQMEKVAEGVDPMNVIRDPEKNKYIAFGQEQRLPKTYRQGMFTYGATARYSPAVGEIEELFAKAYAAMPE
jgi:5,5'-dehydrodivanillate O-demethylase